MDGCLPHLRTADPGRAGAGRSCGSRSVGEEELPRRSRSQELAALTKPLLQTGLGISGLILLINGIPDFIHMLMTITYVDTHMYPDHMQRELSANFVQVIVKMLLGLCLAIGAGGLTRYFTRSSSS